MSGNPNVGILTTRNLSLANDTLGHFTIATGTPPNTRATPYWQWLNGGQGYVPDLSFTATDPSSIETRRLLRSLRASLSVLLELPFLRSSAN